MYSSPNYVQVIKSSRMRWAGHVVHMGERRGLDRVLVGKPEGKRPLGRPRHRWEDNINPLNTELNPICMSQLAELFCGIFKFCACFSKNLNISRTKRDKFVKQKAFCGEGNRQ